MKNFIKKIEALDIETIWDNDIAKPIAIAITKNKKILYKQVEVKDIESDTIINFLLETCTSNKIYYVHNLSFEIFCFLQFFIKYNIQFKIIISNNTVYYAELHTQKKKIKLYCSYRLTLLSLKNLAKLYPKQEQKTIFPYSILTINFKDQIEINSSMFNNEEDYIYFKKTYGIKINAYKILENYCKNDTLITKNAIKAFWEIIEKLDFKKKNKKILTAAKLSVENFFQKNKTIKKQIDIKFDRLLRPYYFGGRVEVFGNPKDDETLLHFDWSGMYAQAMSEKVLGGEIYYSNNVNDFNTPGFYWIEFRQNLKIPVLPIKKEKLIFANGIFSGWYWFEEIQLAHSLGVEILKIDKTITGQFYDFFLKDFVNKNTEIRSISPIHKIIGKNNNNTFYGRLGMNPTKTKEKIITNITDTNNKNLEKIINNNGVYIKSEESEETISNITIASAITSKARIKLYKGILEVEKVGGRVLYVDTDSIIAAFPNKTYKNYLDINLGEVYFNSKDPTTIIEDAVFAMPKTYALKYQNKKTTIKIKGFNNLPDFDNFKKTFYTKNTIKTQNTEWSKKDFIIKLLKKEKNTNLFSLDKRIWSDDLKTTTPHYIK